MRAGSVVPMGLGFIIDRYPRVPLRFTLGYFLAFRTGTSTACKSSREGMAIENAMLSEKRGQTYSQMPPLPRRRA